MSSRIFNKYIDCSTLRCGDPQTRPPRREQVAVRGEQVVVLCGRTHHVYVCLVFVDMPMFVDAGRVRLAVFGDGYRVARSVRFCPNLTTVVGPRAPGAGGHDPVPRRVGPRQRVVAARRGRAEVVLGAAINGISAGEG